MNGPLKKADAVFEGGGVKGIGLVGALSVMERYGYQLENIAGTSAGAIVAALVAAGYSSGELRRILQEVDYTRFMDEGPMDRVPFVGKAISLGVDKGIYEGVYLERWLRGLLAAKGKHTFRDLVIPEYADDSRYRYRLRVIAADVSREEMLVLPQDVRAYGIEPDNLDIAAAVRMSASIPFFFEPVKLLHASSGTTSYIVDGGILTNFPVFLFDVEGVPEWPTFGFLIVADAIEKELGFLPTGISGPLGLFAGILRTMLEAHDKQYLKDADFVRTVTVPSCGVKTTDFSLPSTKVEELYNAGMRSAEDFFRLWDFESYKEMYRKQAPPSRRSRVRT